MPSLLSIPFPAWLVGVLFLVAMMIGFAVAMTWAASRNAGKIQETLDKLGDGTDKDDEGDEDDDETEQVWDVLVKFKDGSEARWRDVTKWAQMPYGSGLELVTEKGIIVVPFENVLWIVDEDATPERMAAPKQLNG